MHIPHNEIVTVLGAALSLVVFMLGYWRGHYRAYAECCDCCTCQDCTERNRDEDEDYDYPLSPVAATGEDRRTTVSVDAWRPDQDRRRPVMVLEPGPTIYPALAELAGEVMDGPHSDPEPIDSTWLRLLMLDWDRRYPIPQEVR